MPKAIFIESAIYTQVQVQDCWILAAKFFFVFFKDWDEVKVNKKVKKNEADFQPYGITGQAWSITDLLHGHKEKFAMQRNPKRGRVANENTGFAPSCPLANSAM